MTTRRRTVAYGALTLLALALIGEGIARFALGLGTPPLYVEDAAMEYRPAPNQDVRRFGKRHVYNEDGMRSPSLETSGYEHLTLVLGDSILNGGTYTDQSGLSTSLASAAAPDRLFGNVSAGSWGPGNIRAWLERYGTLDADTLIFVLSSHDASDAMTFAPLDPVARPTRRPALALIEGIRRTAPRYLPGFLAEPIRYRPIPHSTVANAGDARASPLGSLSIMLEEARGGALPVCLIKSQTMSELAGGPEPGHEQITGVFDARNVPVLDMGPALADSLARGDDPFQDDIHLNATGQAILSETILACQQSARVPGPAR